jgi:hypothetical protein
LLQRLQDEGLGFFDGEGLRGVELVFIAIIGAVVE